MQDRVKNKIGTSGPDISVVIPALNAGATIGATVADLVALREVIVVDGGSHDGTQCAARRAGARVIAAPKGRGSQLAAGIVAAEGEWLLLLHADTRLGAGWDEAVRRHVANSRGVAGYFRFTLDSPTPQARRLERAVAWRCRRLGLPYGDQGLLIHRDLLAEVGGMRGLPIMEDVDLVRRIGRDRLTGLAADAITSAARWERGGWYARSARNLACLSLWWLGVPPAVIRRLYG